MGIKITKNNGNVTEKSKYNVKINKTESDNKNTLDTQLYGKIKIVDSVDYNKYVCFDTSDEYDLYISNDANSLVAVKQECLTEDKDDINDKDDNDKLVNTIIKKYNLDSNLVNWSFIDNAVIIKSDNKQTLQDIYNDYITNKEYKPEFITNDILFLNNINDIKLEDSINDIFSKLDNTTIKNIVSKSGIKLTGSENRDQLIGMVKGTLASTNKTV